MKSTFKTLALSTALLSTSSFLSSVDALVFPGTGTTEILLSGGVSDGENHNLTATVFSNNAANPADINIYVHGEHADINMHFSGMPAEWLNPMYGNWEPANLHLVRDMSDNRFKLENMHTPGTYLSSSVQIRQSGATSSPISFDFQAFERVDVSSTPPTVTENHSEPSEVMGVSFQSGKLVATAADGRSEELSVDLSASEAVMNVTAISALETGATAVEFSSDLDAQSGRTTTKLIVTR